SPPPLLAARATARRAGDQAKRVEADGRRRGGGGAGRRGGDSRPRSAPPLSCYPAPGAHPADGDLLALSVATRRGGCARGAPAGVREARSRWTGELGPTGGRDATDEARGAWPRRATSGHPAGPPARARR